jgi:hypothetical protein
MLIFSDVTETICTTVTHRGSRTQQAERFSKIEGVAPEDRWEVFPMIGKHFMLTQSTLVIDCVDKKRTAVHIPSTSRITVLPDFAKKGVMREVLWEGRRVSMFAADLKDRGIEIIDGYTAGA